jgi:Holliday junction DNA helicase RuvA
MIASLTGRLAFKAPTHLVLDVHGVGYEVLIPLSTYYGLPNLSESTSLSVHTHVREDAIQLFGFLTSQEKDAFVLLTSVSGVGPKLALSLLSAAGAVSAHELPSHGQDAIFDDALSALVNLGYRPQDAKDALKQVKKSNAESIALKDMIRESLKELARG